MSFVYILHSPAKDTFYIGATTEDVSIRLKRHLEKYYGSAYTSAIKDWEVFLQIECSSMHQSLLVEKHIKKMKSKKYLINLRSYPEIIDRLKEKYRDK